jgi:DNA-directed RNA polymerase subunit beta'
MAKPNPTAESIFKPSDSLRDYAGAININQIEALRISIASPQQILNWVRSQYKQTEKENPLLDRPKEGQLDFPIIGEVRKPETINYRTFKPERDGLFCERIFGPVKDYECACGKYKRIKYRGVVCDRCGVEVTKANVRRSRLGYIRLAAPVCHIWFFKGTPSRIGNLLDLTMAALSRVLYFQEYIVVDAGDVPGIQERQLLSEEKYQDLAREYPDRFVAKMGAEAIKDLLGKIDCASLAAQLHKEMKETTSIQKRKRIIKRLKVVEAFRDSGNNPQWMIMDTIPVLPPDLRPLVPLDGGRFASSDLNDLYRRVINRNNRLRKLMEINAPEVIIRNEKRMLQEAVDALFDNGRRGKPIRGQNNIPLKSLSDMLKGKQGRFRQNLLGKRVDYSGRSVIVVGPELKFYQCGLPKKMALELFEPFIIRKLEERGLANTIKSAKRMIEREEKEVFDVLEEVTKGHPVMLNRAPTLHRLGIQAFLPVLVEGKAIRLHPMVCTAFNADFDGDQMAVHVPLSSEAVWEAKNIMLSTNNILMPSSGRPVAGPTQDAVLGNYYLTKEESGAKGEGKLFGTQEEVSLAYDAGIVDLHAKIRIRRPNKEEGGYQWVNTTVGRVLFNMELPTDLDFLDPKQPFSNCALNKKNLGGLVASYHKKYGNEKTVDLLDRLKAIGFKFATLAGISISINDFLVPTRKKDILGVAQGEVERVMKDFRRGVITNSERYNKIIDIWTRTTEDVAAAMMGELEKDQKGFNPIFIMADSGARGSQLQIRQLAGMRGLMAKPIKRLTGGIGEIIENPISSNFREGLTVLEYFISTHGARKGLADTALKTADAGYLTRRLVDVAQDMIITEDDCNTIKGIDIRAIKEITPKGERILESLGDRVQGRVVLEDVIDPQTGETIIEANNLVDEATAKKIEQARIEEVRIRSVLTCETRRGVCSKCYGADLSTGKMVDIGEAVGTIAAQSIGEPGTQLTLRTFHIGGAASLKLEGWYQATKDGVVVYHDIKCVKNREGKYVVLNRGGYITLNEPAPKDAASSVPYGLEFQRFPNIVYGAIISVGDGEPIKANERVVTWDPHNILILAEVSGTVRFVDIVEGLTMKRDVDEVSGNVIRVITEQKTESRAQQKRPGVEILDEKGNVVGSYSLPSSCQLLATIDDGKPIFAGDTIARIPKEKSISKDITGGLPRVAELFEARRPKEKATIAEVDGLVQVGDIHRGYRKVTITPDFGDERVYDIPLHRHLHVRSGDRIKAGEQLTDGVVDPHDVLKIKGQKEVQQFLLNEIQEVYRLQGVGINDKHIEVIIRQMLRKVTVREIGDTTFLFDQQVDRFTFDEENDRVAREGGQLAQADPKLLGITKASLETESFFSAASFQETTRVLTEAAVQGKLDLLRGLKENVIIGRLIPAGTGIQNSSKALRMAEAIQKERAQQQREALSPLANIQTDDEGPAAEEEIVNEEQESEIFTGSEDFNGEEEESEDNFNGEVEQD